MTPDSQSTGSQLTSRPAIFAYGVVVVIAAVLIGAFVVAPLLGSSPQIAKYNVDSAKVAIGGYDTVAYFTEGKPIKGKGEFEENWEDARWHFASATNRELFKANPERYAPRYGGYCTGGIAVGEYADGDPEAWSIVEGKLYFLKNKEVRAHWAKAPQAHLDYAEYNWHKFRGEFRDNR